MGTGLYDFPAAVVVADNNSYEISMWLDVQQFPCFSPLAVTISQPPRTFQDVFLKNEQFTYCYSVISNMYKGFSEFPALIL